ncbi:MAG TPA: HAD-IA family hydrolase [Candidatus Saccharimonadales bacterium]|nr:HAD-IA family hydrolase [Candidatus Saccharimonadales bacterium]
MKTALIVSGGGFQGLTLVRSLQQLKDVRVVVCDIYPENVTRYLCLDYIVAPPLSDLDAFKRFLFETVQREKIDAIFPSTSIELAALSQLKQKLHAHGAIVAVSDHALLDTLLDKQHTHTWLCGAGLPVQPLLQPVASDVEFPIFGRPRDGWGGRETILLRHLQDVTAHAADISTHVWTRFLPEFDEFSADFAINAASGISPIVLRRRLRTSGGFAVISDSVIDPPLENLAARTAQAIATAGGSGLFNIQILVTPNAGTYISDVNPRSGTSATHALAESINLAGFFMDSVGGTPVAPHVAPRKQARTVRVLEDIVVPHLPRRPRGIVFDLDDTLVDHKLWMLEKIEGLYPAIFEGCIDREMFLLCAARLIDEGVRADLIDRLLDELALSPTLRDKAIHLYRKTIVSPTPLFDDVAPVLTALKAKGFVLGALTDNPPATQQAKVKYATPLDCLDAIIYSREHGKEKPDSAGFIQAATALGTSPDQLVMVGDNYFRDGVGAIRAGYMHALIVGREGTLLSHHTGIAARLGINESRLIDRVDSLLSVFHACSES